MSGATIDEVTRLARAYAVSRDVNLTHPEWDCLFRFARDVQNPHGIGASRINQDALDQATYSLLNASSPALRILWESRLRNRPKLVRDIHRVVEDSALLKGALAVTSSAPVVNVDIMARGLEVSREVPSHKPSEGGKVLKLVSTSTRYIPLEDYLSQARWYDQLCAHIDEMICAADAASCERLAFIARYFLVRRLATDMVASDYIWNQIGLRALHGLSELQSDLAIPFINSISVGNIKVVAYVYDGFEGYKKRVAKVEDGKIVRVEKANGPFLVVCRPDSITVSQVLARLLSHGSFGGRLTDTLRKINYESRRLPMAIVAFDPDHSVYVVRYHESEDSLWMVEGILEAVTACQDLEAFLKFNSLYGRYPKDIWEWVDLGVLIQSESDGASLRRLIEESGNDLSESTANLCCVALSPLLPTSYHEFVFKTLFDPIGETRKSLAARFSNFLTALGNNRPAQTSFSKYLRDHVEYARKFEDVLRAWPKLFYKFHYLDEDEFLRRVLLESLWKLPLSTGVLPRMFLERGYSAEELTERAIVCLEESAKLGWLEPGKLFRNEVGDFHKFLIEFGTEEAARYFERLHRAQFWLLRSRFGFDQLARQIRNRLGSQ